MFANKLSDLDDFLAPSLECIKPLLPPKKSATNQTLDLTAMDDLPQITNNSQKVKPDLIKSGADKIASVSLTDCLACSGCVTSAETVLI